MNFSVVPTEFHSKLNVTVFSISGSWDSRLNHFLLVTMVDVLDVLDIFDIFDNFLNIH